MVPRRRAAGHGWVASLAIAAALAARAHAADANIERGRYLTEEVAHCQECHTPRDAHGEFDRGRWLMGGPVFYEPATPIEGWVDRAPAIAGLPGWLDDGDVVFLLMRGARPDGTVPHPPMKQFHMSEADAKAVVAYLRSLRTAEPSPTR